MSERKKSGKLMKLKKGGKHKTRKEKKYSYSTHTMLFVATHESEDEHIGHFLCGNELEIWFSKDDCLNLTENDTEKLRNYDLTTGEENTNIKIID